MPLPSVDAKLIASAIDRLSLEVGALRDTIGQIDIVTVGQMERLVRITKTALEMMEGDAMK